MPAEREQIAIEHEILEGTPQAGFGIALGDDCAFAHWRIIGDSREIGEPRMTDIRHP
jgi:hypothetical protein